MRKKTNNLPDLILFALFSVFQNAHTTQAVEIILNHQWNQASAVNRAPPFYIWQNDPGLTEFLMPNGTTGLCVPAAIANSMIYQYHFKQPRSEKLKIPGLSADQTKIDGNTAIRYFAKLCDTGKQGGTTLNDAALCMAKFYRDSGYTNAEVRVIRNEVELNDPNIQIENRAPTLEDIQFAIHQGYEVIASIVFMRLKPGSGWIRTAGHSFNVYGIQGNELYISNPTRAYRMNFVDPVFDIATLSESNQSYLSTHSYSSLEITGRLLNKTGQSTFLAGLTLIKAN